MATRQEIRNHLSQVLNSEQFVASRSVAKLLSFCVDAVLAGQEETLKETTIGVYCFGRNPGYDTKQDPIVRVTAGRLRSKLELFYQKAEESHGLRIVLLKGTYVPRFDYRPLQPAQASLPLDLDSTGVDSAALSPRLVLKERSMPAEAVSCEAAIPVLQKKSWFVPAALSLLFVAGLVSAVAILPYTGFRRDEATIESRKNLSHQGAPAEASASATSGNEGMGSVAAKAGNIATSVEPRL